MQVNILEKVRPGDTVTIRPNLVADGGVFYLAACAIGGEDRLQSAESSAEILLLSPEGKIVDRGRSGFS
jgi:hypothetical protein